MQPTRIATIALLIGWFSLEGDPLGAQAPAGGAHGALGGSGGASLLGGNRAAAPQQAGGHHGALGGSGGDGLLVAPKLTPAAKPRSRPTPFSSTMPDTVLAGTRFHLGLLAPFALALGMVLGLLLHLARLRLSRTYQSVRISPK